LGDLNILKLGIIMSDAAITTIRDPQDQSNYVTFDDSSGDKKYQQGENIIDFHASLDLGANGRTGVRATQLIDFVGTSSEDEYYVATMYEDTDGASNNGVSNPIPSGYNSVYIEGGGWRA
jgi:hypothetical protein